MLPLKAPGKDLLQAYSFGSSLAGGSAAPHVIFLKTPIGMDQLPGGPVIPVLVQILFPRVRAGLGLAPNHRIQQWLWVSLPGGHDDTRSSSC